ncbi:MAG: GNAT family N-acetyltransferase [Tannerella sp.]|nr:GNAT family N-acetyltransferase [Tannerella sp.]
MERIKLVKPEKKHASSVKDYVKEHADHGEFDIHGGALVEKLTYDAWLQQLADNADKATTLPGWVLSSTFLAIRESDNQLIGMVDIRHELNESLRYYGGHIGYSVRPSARKRGYATQIVVEALDFCRSIGLKKVLLACYKDNLASRNTITKCGGVFEKEILLETSLPETGCHEQKEVQLFWITLTDSTIHS